MRAVKEFAGNEFYFVAVKKLGDKYVIIANNAEEDRNFEFLGKDLTAVFESEEDAIAWWNSDSSAYKGEEIFAL